MWVHEKYVHDCLIFVHPSSLYTKSVLRKQFMYLSTFAVDNFNGITEKINKYCLTSIHLQRLGLIPIESLDGFNGPPARSRTWIYRLGGDCTIHCATAG